MDINSYIADLPSVEAASFDEYAELMRLYILTAKKSDSFEGTKRLLTELYPDNAHFIYELLQNAEDAEAEEVIFEVKNDRLIFRHNGKKTFTLKDVKGITNIGNSTKKEDYTKVGKFGIGFKSVFAFTDNPKIYSDDFNFEIQDMLLPVKVEANSSRKKGDTFFEFPFKGNADDIKKYITQIEKELQALDANTIMFLDNIKVLKYTLLDRKSGRVEKEKVAPNIYQIEISARKEKTYWLIFEKNVLGNKDTKKNKLHVNISYALKESVDSWSIVPTMGTVNIFFPAVKENSGLRFNINGPFASTVARDSIRECEENDIIFEAIRELAVESLVFIGSNNLISMGLYETMPNNEDVLTGKYAQIRETIIETFNQHELVLSSKGEYYRSKDLVKTIPSIQNLFAFSEMKELMGYEERDWCCTIPVRNKNCRAFFDSLNIRSCTYRSFAKLFDDEHRCNFETIIKNKGFSWFRNLYVVLIDLCNFYHEGKLMAQYPALIEKMKDTKMILTAVGTLKEPRNIFLCGTDTTERLEQFVNERLKNFKEIEPLWKILGIQEFGDKSTGQYLIQRLEEYQYPSDDYFEDLLKLSKYAAGIDPEKIKSHRIWFAAGEKKKCSAENLYLDSPYENTGYANIACVIRGINGLSPVYKENYTSEELKKIIAFLKGIGIATELEVIRTDVRKNPLYNGVLYKYSDNVTSHSTSEDYTISHLDDLLDSKSVPVSKMIWNYLINLQTLPRFCKASFSPNRTTQPRKCDSYLIQKLKEKAWIPSKIDNCFYKPSDISKEMLQEDFSWRDDTPFLSLILFGTDKNKVKLQSEKLINDWGVDTESEQAKALRALLSNPQIAGKILNLVNHEKENQYNLAEAIAAQSRGGVVSNFDEVDYDSSAVNNVERRTRKIKEELEEGIKKPRALKRIDFISRTKSSPEERLFLAEQYHGRCQICNGSIKKWNGQNYFEGINLIDTKNLDEKFKKSLDIGWNSLCLCPNHAAEYKYGAVDLSDLIEKIKAISVVERNSDLVNLPIGMQGQVVNIRYTPKHFLALKAAVEFFNEH